MPSTHVTRSLVNPNTQPARCVPLRVLQARAVNDSGDRLLDRLGRQFGPQRETAGRSTPISALMPAHIFRFDNESRTIVMRVGETRQPGRMATIVTRRRSAVVIEHPPTGKWVPPNRRPRRGGYPHSQPALRPVAPLLAPTFESSPPGHAMSQHRGRSQLVAATRVAHPVSRPLSTNVRLAAPAPADRRRAGNSAGDPLPPEILVQSGIRVRNAEWIDASHPVCVLAPEPVASRLPSKARLSAPV